MTHPTNPVSRITLYYTLNPPSQHTTIVIQQYGFSAVTGWDPATGLGTINFKNLKQVGGGMSAIPSLSYLYSSLKLLECEMYLW